MMGGNDGSREILREETRKLLLRRIRFDQQKAHRIQESRDGNLRAQLV